MNNSEATASRLSLSNRALGLSAPGTSSMRSKANALKDSGVKVINFAAGELSFDACQEMRAGAIGPGQPQAWRTAGGHRAAHRQGRG